MLAPLKNRDVMTHISNRLLAHRMFKVALLIGFVQACHTGQPTSTRSEPIFTTMEEALAHVATKTKLQPIFIVEGKLMETVQAEVRSRIRQIEVALGGGSHCRVEYAINGVCRPLLLITLQSRH